MHIDAALSIEVGPCSKSMNNQSYPALFIIDEISDPLKFRTPIPIARSSFFNFCFAALIGDIMSLFLSKIIEVFWGQ
jgi:hypothetical protein